MTKKREQIEPRSQPRKTPEAPQKVDTTATQEKGAELKDDLDEILDEIDSVLEENAAEFVAQYQQKGGE